MTCRFSLSLLTLALGAISSTTMAAPYAFEARQEAMGGTGVASARYLSAPLYNPARLAFAKADDDVGQDWHTLRILPDVMLTRLEQLLTLL